MLDPLSSSVNVAAVDELKTSGAKAAASAADAARDAQVVFTMLPSSPHVRSVYESQVFGAAPRGSLLVDCSTIDPNVTRSLGKQATDHGMRMVDAPVSGGVGGAQAGTLTFMVGGPTADFAAVKPLLQAMGKNIVHCGDLGTGQVRSDSHASMDEDVTGADDGGGGVVAQVAKICNNLVLGISMSAVSEAMSLGVKLGIDPSTLAGIINTSSGRCWSSDTYNPCPGACRLSNDHLPTLSEPYGCPVYRGDAQCTIITRVHGRFRSRPHEEGPGPGRRRSRFCGRCSSNRSVICVPVCLPLSPGNMVL